MKIAFDLDDILVSFQLGWLAYNNKNYGTNLKYEDFFDTHYPKVMNLSEEEAFRRLFEFFETEDMKKLQPVPGAVETVNILKKEHELSVMTSRPLEIEQVTRDWLKQYFDGAFKDIVFSSQITREGANKKVTKGELCERFGIDCLVEDTISYAQSVAEKEIYAILVKKPWNKDFTSDNNYLLRADSIEVLPELLMSIVIS